MVQPTSANAHISYYTAGQFGKASKSLPLSEVYELIKSDEDIRLKTLAIQQAHSEGIANGFLDGTKALYQAQKKSTLALVCYTGNIDRSTGAKPSFYHIGRVPIDIDEGSRDHLRLFRRLVKLGQFPQFEAVGRSVSGFINGSLWANALVEIPEDYQYNYDQLASLHKRYHAYICHLLNNITIVHLEHNGNIKDRTVIRVSADTLHLLGIKSEYNLPTIASTNSHDVKRGRYLTHDRDLIEQDGKPFTYAELIEWEATQKQVKKIARMERKTKHITATDHFDFCDQFARGLGFIYTDGQKNEYLARFCIGASLLGIPEEVTRAYVMDNIHAEEDGDWLRGTYARYSASFGIWKHRVKIDQDSFQPMHVEADTFLTFDKYLTDSPDFPKLLEQIGDLPRTLLCVPTGSGKTVASVNELRKRLKAQYPDKTFMFLCPLKAITEQVGLNTDMQVVCEGHTSSWSAVFDDSIMTVKSFLDFIEMHADEDLLKDIILVFDEAHELITGAGYQRFGTLPYIFDHVFKVIGLTATPLHPLVSQLNFTPIKCSRRQNPKVNIEYKRIKKNELDRHVIAFGNRHKSDKVLYFYNGKEDLMRWTEVFQQKDIKADYYHRDVKGKKGGFYRNLIEEGELPDTTDHLFSTKILSFGTSFKKLDRIVYITKRDTKDYLEFVQSLARLREDVINVTVFIVEPKAENERKYRPYDFDLQRLAEDRERLAHEADEINRHERNRATHATGVSYKASESQEHSQLIPKNAITGEYFVNDLYLLSQQYSRSIRAYSADDFIKCLHHIPNATIKECGQEDSVSVDDLHTLAVVDDERNTRHEADRQQIKDTLTNHEEQLFKYVYDHTEDQKLKKRIKERLPLVKVEDDLKDVEAINNNFALVELVVHRYLTLTNGYTADYDRGRVIEYCFERSNRKYGRLLKQLNSLYNVKQREAKVQGLEYGHAKGLIRQRITDAHLQLIDCIGRLQGNSIPIADLHEEVSAEGWYSALELNDRTFTEVIGFFFHIEKTRTKKTRCLRIGKRKTLLDVMGDNIEILLTKVIAV